MQHQATARRNVPDIQGYVTGNPLENPVCRYDLSYIHVQGHLTGVCWVEQHTP